MSHFHDFPKLASAKFILCSTNISWKLLLSLIFPNINFPFFKRWVKNIHHDPSASSVVCETEHLFSCISSSGNYCSAPLVCFYYICVCVCACACIWVWTHVGGQGSEDNFLENFSPITWVSRIELGSADMVAVTYTTEGAVRPALVSLFLVSFCLLLLICKLIPICSNPWFLIGCKHFLLTFPVSFDFVVYFRNSILNLRGSQSANHFLLWLPGFVSCLKKSFLPL